MKLFNFIKPKSKRKLKIFISSPKVGLEKERDFLIKKLHKRYSPSAMEIWESSPEKPLNVCLREVKESNVVILITGPYYGSIEPNSNLSFTELEYNEANAYGGDVYHFFKISKKRTEFISKETDKEKQEKHYAFFNRIWQFRGPGFINCHDLTKQVFRALDGHEKKRREKPRPFVSADVYYKNFLNKKSYIRHDQEIIGRAKDLEKLNEFLKSDHKVFILYGRGGLGKSKVLYDFAKNIEKDSKKTWKHVLFLWEVFDIDENTLKEMPLSSCILILDDGHRYEDLENLLSIFKGDVPPQQIKLILSSRPLGKERIDYAISRNIDRSAIIEYSLDDLTYDDVKTLTSNILKNKNRNAISAIANATKDCPLATVVACNLINEKAINPAIISQKEEFKQIIFDKFLEEIKGKDLKDSESQTLLEYIAALAPVIPSDALFKEKMSNILKLRPWDLDKKINILEERGLLLRKGRMIKISPDLLSDHILYNACINKSGSPSTFSSDVITEFEELYLKNILFNISEVEWKARLSSKPVNLLGGIWNKMKTTFKDASNFERIRILEEIEKAAVFQPSHVLEIIQIALKNPLQPDKPREGLLAFGRWAHDDVMNKMPNLLRRIAYNIDFFEKACDILWDLGKVEKREIGGYPESPIRILQDLAEYGIRKPKIYNDKMLSCIEKWLELDDTYSYQYSPLDILTKLLSKEGEDTEFRKGAFVMSGFALNFDVIDDIRTEALRLLENHLDTKKPKHIIYKALEILTNTMSYPHGLFGRPITSREHDYHEKEQLKICDILKRTISQLKNPIINTIIKKDLRWFQLHGRTDIIKAKVAEIVDSINEDDNFRIYRSLIGNFREFLEQDHNWEKHNLIIEKETKEVAIILLKNNKNTLELFNTLNSAISDIEEYRLSHNASHVFSQIAKDNPEIALEVSILILDNPKTPTAQYYFSSLIWPLRLNTKFNKTIQAIMSKAVRKKDYWPCLNIAHSYSYGIDNYDEVDFENIRFLLLMKNENITKSLIHGIAKIGKQGHSIAQELALLVDLGSFPKLADDYCSIYDDKYGIPFSKLTLKDVEKIFNKLLLINTFDHNFYHADKLFEALSKNKDYLPLSIAFLIKRVEIYISNKKKSKKYDPLPLLGFTHAFTDISHIDGFKKHIAQVRDLALNDEMSNDYFCLPSLFKAVSDHYSLPSLDVLSEWLASKDEKKIKSIALLVKEAPANFLFDNVKFVSTLLENAHNLSDDCYKYVKSYLFGIILEGGISRTYGKPAPKHIWIRDKSDEILKILTPHSVASSFYNDLKDYALKEMDDDIQKDEELDE